MGEGGFLIVVDSFEMERGKWQGTESDFQDLRADFKSWEKPLLTASKKQGTECG